ncbi:MAG: CapA family protein [Treponema sp.]|jgi:poly-gamma-glutamate synthesis protein (capsule biosynthesis protein)|nr:CapA family protein [Treponema sp.]
MKKPYAVFLTLLLLSGFDCRSSGSAGGETAETVRAETGENETEQNPVSEETVVTLLAAGDNLIHDIIYLAARTDGNSYDFDPAYSRIKAIVEKADIAMVNQETALGGTALGLSGYPVFNSPQETGTALANAGFDVVNHASNHTMDRGEKAVTATMDFWDTFNENREEKVTYLGIFRSGEDRETKKSIITKKGISFGFLSYTYGLNGFSLPAGKDWLVGLIDTGVMAREIDALRPDCDILVVSMHWGDEFRHSANETQKELAAFMAEHKVDLVIGHHPHVTQGCEIIPRPDGKTLTCYYSLGDLLSHTQTGSSPDTMLGAMAWITVKKRGPAAESVVSVTGAGAIPTVCHYGKERRPAFTVYPLWDYTEELAALHYKSEKISLEYLYRVSREVFGMRMFEREP